MTLSFGLKEVSKQEFPSGVVSHCCPKLSQTTSFNPNPTYNTGSVVSPEITTAAENRRLSRGEASPHN